jgi:hypothetical protein
MLIPHRQGPVITPNPHVQGGSHLVAIKAQEYLPKCGSVDDICQEEMFATHKLHRASNVQQTWVPNNINKHYLAASESNKQNFQHTQWYFQPESKSFQTPGCKISVQEKDIQLT